MTLGCACDFWLKEISCMLDRFHCSASSPYKILF